MDAKQFLMDHSELPWDVKYNAFVNAVTSALNGGGTVEHLVNPVTFVNGATGNSDAWIIEVNNYKLVYLTLSNVLWNSDSVAKYANQFVVPDNIAPADIVRISFTQSEMAANSEETKKNFAVWVTGSTTNWTSKQYGAGFYISIDQ